LIPNTNVGGSGGFTRGLLYLKDNGFSHCLFMDDDASCHEESIKRTYAYWSYVVDDRSMGISGILFDENFPVTVLEAGGRWSERGWFGVFQKKNAAQAQPVPHETFSGSELFFASQISLTILS